jgi:hypothetical protein
MSVIHFEIRQSIFYYEPFPDFVETIIQVKYYQ